MAELVILTSRHKAMVPIIKVVGNSCNLRCRYCFYNTLDQSTPNIMSNKLLQKFISEYLNLFSGHLTFIWHGGEPLLAGLSFFRNAVDIQLKNSKPSQIIHNAIQTNATLIDEEWAEFFKKENFRVGVSLDGGAESHNHFRKNYAGKGSFDRAMRGIGILRRFGILSGVIQTITHDSASNAEKDFDFLANALGIKSWGVNIFLDLDGINKAMVDQSVTNNDLIRFIKTYIDLWLAKDDSQLKIREIENFIAGIFKKRATSCAFNGSCTGYFCLEYNGKIYPCDRSSNCPELLFGNLSRQSLLEILNGSIRLQYAESVNSAHPDCKDCEWNQVCNNGCAMQRMDGIRGKYYYCKMRKAIFEYLKEKIEKFKSTQQ